MNIRRRDFIKRLGSASGLSLGGGLLARTLAVGRGQLSSQSDAANQALPAPGSSGIKHIVVVTMENRSFDHFLGWLPNADAQQSFTYPTPNGGIQNTQHWPDFQGCGHPDPDHSYTGGRIEYNNGSMDGWLLDTSNDNYAIGYYNEPDLPFLSALARNYLTLDNYFCSILAPTFPNRLFMLAGQTDRLDNSFTLTRLPTIFDRLSSARIKTLYYYSNVPFTALWGLKYLLISRTYGDFLSDAASGRLPAVSFLDPRFTILDDDTGSDDEPHSNILRGESFLAATFNAVASGPAWSGTVFLVTFDEWGGFFDHVAPQRVVAPNNVDPDVGTGGVLLGFRVPTIIASPWTRNTHPTNPVVNNTLFDHTSILKLIEWRWGLRPLTTRDGSDEIGNLATALDFTAPITAVPSLQQPASPLSSPCSLLSAFTIVERQSTGMSWAALRKSAKRQGWKVDGQSR